MKTFLLSRALVSSLAVMAALPLASSQAGTFTTDFNSGIPAGMTLYGTALGYDHSTGGVNNSGVLKLTDATGSQLGGAIIDDFDGGATVAGFDVTFDLYIGSGNGADGLSFFFGDFADGAQSEEGPGSIEGLTISFDVFNNGGAIAEAPAIDLKWNNVVLAHRLVGAASATTGAQPIGSVNTIRTQATQGGAAIYWPVKIHVDTDGTLDLVYGTNSTVIFTNLPVFRPITNAPTRGPAIRFGFGARTGGSFDNHFVDNLNITTFPADSKTGQPFLSVLRPVQLVNATTGGNPTQINPVIIVLQDQIYLADTNTLALRYNNNAVVPAIFRSGPATVIVYAGVNGLLPTGVADVNLSYATTSSPAYSNSFTYRFAVNAAVGSPAQVNPANYPLTAADLTKPGFKAKVHQMNVNRNPATGLVPNAERQIANGYIDPATGQPYANTANLSLTNEPGAFLIPGVWNVNGGDGGGVGNFPNDDPVPGIPGGNDTDRYVVSLETILDLAAGVYRFGVNSDDGFRLSIGRGPGDVVGMELGTAGDRGATDSLMDVYIPVNGFYPVRLMWWETGGGSSCEFFVQDFGSGANTLINDLTATSPIKAYRESPVTPPYISRTLPAVNYGYAFADQDVVIDVTDGAFPMDSGSAALTINGTAQIITANKTGKVTTLTRAGSLANLLPSRINNVRLIYSYITGANTVSLTNDWAFTVPAYTWPIPVANKVSAGQVSGAGFHVRGYQIDRSGDANQGNGGRHTGNNMPGAEIELIGGYLNPTNNQPHPNLMLTGGNPPTNPDGSWDVADVLNFNNAQSTGGPAADAGIFNGDTQVSGLPGAGSSNFGLDNSVNEFTTYLDLKAGAYVFGLNVDDGWTCTSAPNPKDTLGTLLGFRNGPGGQNGNPLNNPNAAFNVIVSEDGIYPFRVLYWEGGGGVNIELCSIDRQTGTQILVNDTAGAFPSTTGSSGNLISPITAFNTYTGPVRPWTKFSVYPMPYIGVTSPLVNGGTAVTLWQNRNQQSGPGPINLKIPFLNASWNSGEIQNSSTAQRPFGDAVGAIVADLGTGTVGLVLDGAGVQPTVTDVPNSTDKLVLYTPNPPLSSSSNHIAGLVYAGATNYWIFNVITFSNNIPAGTAVSPNAVDLNSRGFHVKVVQAASGQANTAARAEAQLAGTPASVALPGTNSDGSFTVTGIINWNVTKAPGGTPTEIGNFQPLMTGTPDDPVPGIPGTGLTGTARFENIAAEIFAYLDLPAGYQKFGVNGDDGWKVQIGTPGQINGPILFTIDRGAGSQDLPFAFVTPEAGLYPVRLVWYQGGGGGNVEFFTYGANNEKVPINANRADAVKAYYQLIQAPRLSVMRNADGSVTVSTSTGRIQQSDSLSTPNWADAGTGPITVQPAGTRYYRGTL